MLCPAPRIAISSPFSRAKRIASGTSSSDAHLTIAGRPFVDHRVPDGTNLVVVRGRRGDHVPLHALLESGESVSCQLSHGPFSSFPGSRCRHFGAAAAPTLPSFGETLTSPSGTSPRKRRGTGGGAGAPRRCEASAFSPQCLDGCCSRNSPAATSTAGRPVRFVPLDPGPEECARENRLRSDLPAEWNLRPIPRGATRPRRPSRSLLPPGSSPSANRKSPPGPPSSDSGRPRRDTGTRGGGAAYAQMRAHVEAGAGEPRGRRCGPGTGRLHPATRVGTLPDGTTARDAVQVLSAAADTARVVMVNERHHAASDRLLTLELLPILWDKGFRYFAAENARPRRPGASRSRVPGGGDRRLHEGPGLRGGDPRSASPGLYDRSLREHWRDRGGRRGVDEATAPRPEPGAQSCASDRRARSGGEGSGPRRLLARRGDRDGAIPPDGGLLPRAHGDRSGHRRPDAP